MKKIFIFCLLSLIIEFGQSQNAPKTTAASVSACPNGSFNISITTNSAVQVGALTLRLDFNPNLITYNSYSNANSLLSGISVNSVLESPNVRYIKIVWLIPSSPNTVNLTAGKIVDLNFTLLSGSPTIQFNNTSNFGGDCEYANGLGVAYNDSLYVNSTITNLGAGTPGSISGLTNVCRGQNNVTYTVPSITNATSYIWTLPTGATGTSSTNSITVNYGSSATSGNITVKGYNATCGNGTSTSLAITVNSIPDAAGTITGSATVCQGQSNVTYTVPSITNATSYIWTLPTGTTGTSSTNSITVNYGTSAVSGNITVKGTNTCGDGNISTKSTTVNPLPVAAGTITGSATVCQGQNSVTYSVPTITNATSYVWSLPTAATGTSSTNSITVNYGTSAVSGNITVKGTNTCGDGSISTKSITVNPLPATAGTITGSATVCQGQNNVTYTVPSITNATSYIWTLPTGAIGASSTNSISVNYGTSAVSGNITVKGNNSCGDGDSSTLLITVAPPPLISTFTAAVSNEWENCGNWNQGIPGYLTDANIPANKLAIVNSTNYECHSLTIAPLGKLTINAGKDLTVSDTLILQSNTTGTASLIDNGTLYSTTNIVERYIPHTFTDEFHMLSSPVATQAISPNFNESDGFFVWNEATGNWIEFANTLNFITSNGGTNFVPGKGYAIAYPNIVTKKFTGNLNTGTINIPLSVTAGLYSGWNFVANPYPSAINWNASSGWNRSILENATASEKAIWIWNPATANYGAYISNSPSDSGTNGVTHNIAISQGFWVKATTAGMLSMDNNIRQHTAQAFLKTTQSANEMIRLKVTSSVNTYSDELIINFGNDNDQGGAEKMFSMNITAPSLYSTKLNKNWSINNLTSITNNTSIPIGFKAGVDGNYNISAIGIQSAGDVMLEDIKTNTQHNFPNENNYSFYALANDNPNRFLLHFNSSMVSETVKQTPKIFYTKQVINISNPWSEKTTLNVYDINGRLLQSYDAKQGNSTLNFNSINGVYIIKLQNEQHVFVKKEVVY